MDFHDKLDVFLNEDKIGTLSTDNGVMSFAYDADYLNTPGAYPLSKNLPLLDLVWPWFNDISAVRDSTPANSSLQIRANTAGVRNNRPT